MSRQVRRAAPRGRPARLAVVAVATALAVLAGGCGITRKVAVGTITPILDETVRATYASRDVATVREAMPANLVLLRGLAASEPGNREIRTAAVQTYFSYANGFIEDEDPARAILLYREGLDLGREGLARRDWFRRAEAGRPLPDSTALAKAEREDVPLLFWTVANWAALIGLTLSEPSAVAELPRVEAYLSRILELEPGYFLGMPHVLAGTILSMRPRMLGGQPEKGKEHFDEALRISQRRMLYFQVMRARYYCRQVLDEGCFDENLREALEAPDDILPEYRLMNRLAQEKARRLMEKRDELF